MSYREPVTRLLGALAVAAVVGCGDAPPAPDGAGLDATPAEDVGDSVDAPPIEDARGPDAARPARVTRVYTAQDDGQIVVHSVSELDGTLAELGRTAVPGSPSFLAFDASGTRGAAVLEGSDEVVALRFAAGSGLVTEVGPRRSARGDGPTHVSLDRTGAHALVATYGGGTVSSFRFAVDGSLEEALDTEAPGARAHMIATAPSNRWALVPCLGDDRIAVLAFDPTAGTLTPASAASTADGAGPRHFAITLDGGFVYVNDELSSSVGAYAFDEASGTLTHLQTVTTLPPGFAGPNSTAEIALAPGEQFLYVSNRGHDSVACFHVQPDHTLEPHGHLVLDARRPRSFAVSEVGGAEVGGWLLVGAQDDDLVVAVRIARDGSMTPGARSPLTGAPIFVGVNEVPLE
jgi:6-phosphogluconolactonase